MKNIYIKDINDGDSFSISDFLISNIQKIKLMEIGILPKIKMKLVKKSYFGTTIIECEGNKFALDNFIAEKILIKLIES